MSGPLGDLDRADTGIEEPRDGYGGRSSGLGSPTSATATILKGAFTINGLVPGAMLFQDNSNVAWAIIASMFVGNVILLILNIPLARVWIQVLNIPYTTLYTFVFAFMLLGAYSISGEVLSIGIMLVAGLIGYVLRKAEIPLAPAALTIVLGPLMENSLRVPGGLRGKRFDLWESPFSATLLGVALLALLLPPIRKLVRTYREKNDREDVHVRQRPRLLW